VIRYHCGGDVEVRKGRDDDPRRTTYGTAQ